MHIHFARCSVVAAVCLWLAGSAVVGAEPLPDPGAIAARLQREAVVVEVRHAHDGLGARAPVLAFRGFPAPDVLDALFGSGWHRSGVELEFIAADGYRSAIPAAQFERYRSWLVYARADGGAFVIDNRFQNRTGVALGPWYLVWDNIGSPELTALGDHYWPYQVVEVKVTGAAGGAAR